MDTLTEADIDAGFVCPICGGGKIMVRGVWGCFPHDHRPDLSGLDDGPHLPGHAPRKKPAPKPPEEIRAIRLRAWATRRARRLPSPPASEGER